MANKIERIKNPDGTTTVKLTRYKKLSDDPSSSAYKDKKERESRDRRRRLMGHDGGPKEGDIRSAEDAETAKKTERRRRMRVLRGDPQGTRTAAGTRRAQRLLTESKDKDELKAWVAGADDERPDLWGGDYRAGYRENQREYREAFRAFTGQDPSGDPDKDQNVINFYERRNLGLPTGTSPVTPEEREAALIPPRRADAPFADDAPAFSPGGVVANRGEIEAWARDNGLRLTDADFQDSEALQEKLDVFQAGQRLYRGQAKAADRRRLEEWAKDNGLHLTDADFEDPVALKHKVDTLVEGKRLYADQVEAAERRELQAWAAGQGLHLTDPDFEDPAALRSKIEVFVAGKQAYADLVRKAEGRTEAQDLAARVALSQSGVTSIPGTPARGWVATQPNVLQRTGDPASVVIGAGLDAFAEQHPYINIDGGWWPTKKIIEANVRPATDARGRSAGGGEHQYYNSDRVAETLNRLTLQGRASTTHETPLVEGKARDPQPAPGAPIPQVEAHDPPESGFTGAMLGVWASQPEVQTAEVEALDTIAGASSAVHLVRVDLESRSPEGPGDALILPGERATALEVAGLGIDLAGEALPLGLIARGGARGVTTVARTFGPRQITIPFTDKVIPGPGGFVSQATPDVSVPRLLLAKDDPAAEAISGEVFKEIGATGRVEGLYGNTEFSYTPTPFGEVMHTANPDRVLHLTSTGRSDLVAPGPIAMDKPALGPAEQYFFVQEGDVTSRFMPGSAFNRTGGKSPGIHVYSDLDAAAVGSEFVRVVEADGAIKQWPRRGSFEVERGIQSGENIPPSYRESTVGIPGGQLYLAEYVALPSYRQRVAANLKAIFDFKNSQRGKFQYRTAPDIEDLSPAGRQLLDERFQAARQAKEAEFQQGLSDGTFTAADRDTFFRSVDDETKAAISREQMAFDVAAPDRAALESRARRAVEDLRQMARNGETPAVRATAIAVLRALERDGVLSTDRFQNQGGRGQSEARTDGPEVVTSQPPRISQSGTEGADRLTEPPLRADITAPVFVPEDIGTPPVVPRVPGAPPSLSTGGVRVPPPILQDITVPSLPAGRDVRVPLPVDRDIGITTPDDRDVGITTHRDRDIRIPQQRDLDDDSPSRRPDLGAPPVGEEGYTEEDEYPRVVAHTKVVEVQTALNDGDTVETPLEVKNFRVVATGRRPHPGKLLEGRHVDVKTDSTGQPKPVQKPPTRHRRRSLNKPPLGPQSRRQPRSSATRQSGVPMLRRIGPRIGRKR